MSNITIYHNPACGTSRNTLEMIRNSGIEPTVILYLETPPSRDELLKLIADMGISVRALLRKNVEPYEELGLAEDKFTDDQLHRLYATASDSDQPSDRSDATGN